MKSLLVATLSASALLAGCAINPQPVTYIDTSTPEQRNVQATGAAAVEAARSNRSINADIAVDRDTEVRVDATGNIIGVVGPIYDRYGNQIILKPDGTRDFDAEARAIYESKDYNYNAKRRGYSGYAVDDFKRQYDFELKRKIRAETRRLIDRIF